jgi:hypothetical protein
MPIRRTTPEQRAKRQLAALSATTRKTIKALAKHPDDHRTWDIIDWHDHQVEKILAPKRKPLPPPPPSEFCWTCEKWHPRPIIEEWSLPVVLRCPWAVGVTAVFLLLFAIFDWWALWVFPVAWFVSFSFPWSLIVPSFLLLLVIVVLGVTVYAFDRRKDMLSYDDKRILCRDSYTIARLLEQAIFANLTSETTPEQYAAALETLRRLRERFEATLDPFHYAAIQGSHQCVRDVCNDAEARLELLAITQPKPHSSLHRGTRSGQRQRYWRRWMRRSTSGRMQQSLAPRKIFRRTGHPDDACTRDGSSAFTGDPGGCT